MIAIEWFRNLSSDNWIAIAAIAVPVVVAAIVGLFKLFSKKTDSTAQQKTIKQKGKKHTAIIADGNKGNVAGGDIHTGIDSKEALDTLVDTSAKLGRSEKENEQLRQTVKQLEEQLAKPAIETNITSEQSIPVPSEEAKELAELINEDDGLYAQALKAIAEGNNEKADDLLDETQQFLDRVQQKKDEAQAKIYMARMQNATYAGKPQDALQYCDKLTTIAGNDTLILNDMAAVYYANAEYKEAEPLMERALKIDEASFGKDHPNIAIRLNNLAQLYKATNRLKEAEPLMERALKIDEASFGKDHPKIAIRLNNLAQLYQDTNRLKEAEPLMERALKIDEASLGKDHPDVAIRLNNLAQLYQDTNRLKEAEPLMERALKIDEASLGKEHPKIAIDLNNLAALYQVTNRFKEAEPLMERALKIDKTSLGKEHPDVAIDLNNLAQLYKATNRLKEAEPLMERHLVIFLQFAHQTGHRHPHLEDAIKNYIALLTQMGYSKEEIHARLKCLAPEVFD